MLPLKKLLLVSSDCVVEDIEISGTPVRTDSGTGHSYESPWQGFMKERLKKITTVKFASTKVRACKTFRPWTSTVFPRVSLHVLRTSW